MAKAIPAQVRRFYFTAPFPQRDTMIEMRNRILEVVPNAKEVISYGMPAFKVDGIIVVGLLAHKKHVGYYPFSGSILNQFPEELEKYSQTKSALHIPIDKPLSRTLIKKLIRARMKL